MQLAEIADVIRSKNAGIHYFTIDIMFEDLDTYERVKDTETLDESLFAELYGLPEEEVRFYEYDVGLAFKVTIPRETTSGSPGDSDVLGAQQHAPVYDIDVDIE